MNLGCGRNNLAGYLNVDYLGGEVKADASQLPFKDNTFDEVLASHILEHVLDLAATMREIHRVLCPGGILQAIVPYGLQTLYNAFHVRAFDLSTIPTAFCKEDDSYTNLQAASLFRVVSREISSYRLPFQYHVRKYLSWTDCTTPSSRPFCLSFPFRPTIGGHFHSTIYKGGTRAMNEESLPSTFYDRDTALVAKELIGKELRHREGDFNIRSRITETEAYLGMVDPSSHLANGFTKRTEGIWGHPGQAYVFLSYGLHCCLNAITLSGWPYGCVLIRGVKDASGPGRLTKHFRIGLEHNGVDLTEGPLTILEPRGKAERVKQTTRIGISKARDMSLRFVEEAP